MGHLIVRGTRIWKTTVSHKQFSYTDLIVLRVSAHILSHHQGANVTKGKLSCKIPYMTVYFVNFCLMMSLCMSRNM